MINSIKGSTEIKGNKKSEFAIVRRMENIVNCGKNCSFGRMMAAISRLKLVKRTQGVETLRERDAHVIQRWCCDWILGGNRQVEICQGLVFSRVELLIQT
jgi:hypothetical protein